MIGKKLAHYEILAEIGQGGMGTVYRARDTKLDRDVALKVLLQEKGGDAERILRFEREAKAVAALNHPNIVTIHAVDQADEITFLVMELLEGDTLDGVLPKGGLRLGKLLELSLPIVEAISYAHGKGITHRDLKPANIMFDEAGRPKVLDFGLAKLLQPALGNEAGATMSIDPTATQEGKILGTAAYMSPEQAEGKPIDHRADIFAMGVLLYEMATGRRPFAGETSLSTLSAVLKDEPVPANELNEDLPRHLGRVIQRCLAKDPSRRYQTALDLRNELEILKQESSSDMTREHSRIINSEPKKKTPIPMGVVLPIAFSAVALIAAMFMLGPWKEANRATTSDVATETSPPPATPPEVAGATNQPIMLAVLPFQYIGPADEAYYADGVTDEIATQLMHVEGLGVISNRSAAQIASKGGTVPEMGKKLGTTYIVEGSVRLERRQGEDDILHVSPNLVQVDEDRRIWNSKYNRPATDIFAMQTEIAQEVAKQLGFALSGTEGSVTTDNLEAYVLYLAGKNLSRYVLMPAEMDSAQATLDKALELDPEYAEAWGGKSINHAAQYHLFQDRTESRLALARECADKAIEFAPNHGIGHAALGYYYYWGRQDYERATELFAKSLELTPGVGETYAALAYVQRRSGDWEGALENLQTAARLQPQDPLIMQELANTLEAFHRFEEAADLRERVKPLAGPLARIHATNGHLAAGNVAKARAEVDTLLSLIGPDAAWLDAWVCLHERDYEKPWRHDEQFNTPLDNVDLYIDGDTFRAQLFKGQGKTQEQHEAARKGILHMKERIEDNPTDHRYRLNAGRAYALAGDSAKATQEARLAMDLMPISKDQITGIDIEREAASIYAMAGDADTAIELLRANSQRVFGSGAKRIANHPGYFSLHDDPRFQALINPAP